MIKAEYQRGLDRFKDFFEEDITLPEVINDAKRYLLQKFGVEDLSVCEGVRLRHCVEESLEAFDNEFLKPSEDDGELLTIPKESACRWIARTYLVGLEYLDREMYRNPYGVSKEFKEWLRLEREACHLL